jgi:hypothetical protein
LQSCFAFWTIAVAVHRGQGAVGPPLSSAPVIATLVKDGVRVTLPGEPSLSFLLQWTPRRDLDPRSAVTVPDRPNVQDFVGLREVILGGIAEPGFWLWDNREHQYWAGYDGSFQPRHADVDDRGYAEVDGFEAWLRWSSDGVETRLRWRALATPGGPAVDTDVTVANVRDDALAGYAQLFANYHPESGPARYLGHDGKLAEAPDYAVLTVAHDAGMRLGAIQAPWIRHPALARVQAAIPMLVSGLLWDGWHHVVMGDSATWGLVTWRSATFPFRAIDMLIGPPAESLGARSGMHARFRHAFMPGPLHTDALQSRWQEFAGGSG